MRSTAPRHVLLYGQLDLYAPIEPMDFSIDNSELSPDDVAERIRQHFRIDCVTG